MGPGLDGPFWTEYTRVYAGKLFIPNGQYFLSLNQSFKARTTTPESRNFQFQVHSVSAQGSFDNALPLHEFLRRTHCRTNFKG